MGCGSSALKKHGGLENGRFKKLSKLGEGASCNVYMAEEVGTGKPFALKQLEKSEELHMELFEQEIALLKTLSRVPHQNVLQYVDHWIDDKHFNIVTTLCSGGELFDRVVDPTIIFTEKLAAMLTKMMLESVQHCHKLNIVHRDIKPENYVFDTDSLDSNMRLIDFGCAQAVTDDGIVSTRCGSPYYISPEVLDGHTPMTGKMWKASDCWSIGVILYMLLTGRAPFRDDRHMNNNIMTQPYRPFRNVELSESVRELVDRMLTKNWAERITTEEALCHPWVTGETATDKEIDKDVIKNLLLFKEKCALQKAVGKVLGGRMGEKDHQKLKSLFSKFDTNNDGRLDSKELQSLFEYIGKGPSEAKEIIDHADQDGDGGLDLDELKTMHAAKDIKDMSDKQLQELFREFDKSGDGLLSSLEVQKLCNVSEEGAKQIIGTVDSSNDGMIDVEEWIAAMKMKKFT